MYITMLPGNNLICLYGKKGLRRITGIEELTITGISGNQLNPFDIMFFFHGMGNTADIDLIAAIHLGNHRHMFFLGSIHGIFSQENHGRAAATEISATRMQDFHNITADITLVNT